MGNRGDAVDGGESNKPFEAEKVTKTKAETGSEKESTSRQKENGEGGRAKANNEPVCHPYIGKRVKVVQGAFRGVTAIITSIKSRGWWTVDHPDIDGVIHSGRCRLLDVVSEDEMREYYEKRGMKYRRPNNHKPIRRKEIPDLSSSSSTFRVKRNSSRMQGLSEDGVAYRTLVTLEKGVSEDQNGENKKDTADASSYDRATEPRREKRKYDPQRMREAEEQLRMSELVDAASNSKSRRLYCDNVSRLRSSQPMPSRRLVLPPIVLKPDEEGDKIPERLQALPQTTRLEVFDRKTGRVLRESQGILLRDLPHALEEHPEYEPIVPPTEYVDQRPAPTYREGRSAPSVRVSASILPQTTNHDLVPGAKVALKGGKYKGTTGTIKNRLPGTWCLVAGIATSGGVTVPAIVSCDDLEVIPQEETRVEEGEGEPSVAPTASTRKEKEDAPDVKKLFQESAKEISTSRIAELEQRVVALAKEERELEEQMRKTMEPSSVATTPEELARERDRLQKKVEFVKSCRKQVEQDVAVARNTARSHQKTLGDA